MAAGDEAELTLRMAQANRHVHRMPGVRSGTGTGTYVGPDGVAQQLGGGRVHHRQGSASSASSGNRRGGIGVVPAPSYISHFHERGLGIRSNTGRKSSIPVPFSVSIQWLST